jgi:hypothetical protein
MGGTTRVLTLGLNLTPLRSPLAEHLSRAERRYCRLQTTVCSVPSLMFCADPVTFSSQHQRRTPTDLT